MDIRQGTAPIRRLHAVDIRQGAAPVRWLRQRRLVVNPTSATSAAVRVVIVDGRVLHRRVVWTEKDVQLRRRPNRLSGHTVKSY